MSRLPDAFREDRALRDAARDVLKADVEHARASLTGKALVGRFTGNVAGRVGAGAVDMVEVAKSHVDDKRGVLAIIIAFIALWFARGPIAEILGEVFGEGDGASEGESDGESDQTDTDPEPEPEPKPKPRSESALDPVKGSVDQGTHTTAVEDDRPEAEALEGNPLKAEPLEAEPPEAKPLEAKPLEAELQTTGETQ